jgi:predicted Zn-dependent protease
MKFLLLPALTALTVGLSVPPNAKDDVVFKALTDEMARSTQRLHLDQYKGPYFVSYTVRQTEVFDVTASFGAVDNSDRDRSRTLRVDVREGDYSLDSHGGGSGGAMAFIGGLGGEHGGSALVVDDNYDAIRHELWLKTDAAYLKAIEDLAAKKAFLQENTVKDPPDSMSREKPVQDIEPAAKLEVDTVKTTAMVRRLSAIFKEFPRIQKSLVRLEDRATTRWFVNSEGFCNRTPKNQCYLIAIASVQADNGAVLSDTEIVGGETAAELPGEEDLEKRMRALATRLTKLADAREIEDYRGPMLFEGEAAADVVSQVLQSNLGHTSEPLSKMGGLSAKFKSPLADRLGSKILPSFISIVDDPLRNHEGDTKIISSYRIDDDGLIAQKITLVDKGVLKTLAMSRMPSREIKQSNGHARGDAGVANNLYVISDNKLAPDKLKEKLIALGKEANVKEVLVARRLWNFFAGSLEPQALLSNVMSGFMGGSELRLSPPVELYSINIETGKEELVRGAQFGNISLRFLRDIEATGDDTRPYLLFSGSNMLRSAETDLCTISTPSILVGELELSKPSKQTTLPPILKNPYFDTQGQIGK